MSVLLHLGILSNVRMASAMLLIAHTMDIVIHTGSQADALVAYQGFSGVSVTVTNIAEPFRRNGRRSYHVAQWACTTGKVTSSVDMAILLI